MFVTIMYSKESNRQLYIDIIVFFSGNLTNYLICGILTSEPT